MLQNWDKRMKRWRCSMTTVRQENFYCVYSAREEIAGIYAQTVPLALLVAIVGISCWQFCWQLLSRSYFWLTINFTSVNPTDPNQVWTSVKARRIQVETLPASRQYVGGSDCVYLFQWRWIYSAVFAVRPNCTAFRITWNHRASVNSVCFQQPIKFLHEIVLSKGMTIAQAKQVMVQELAATQILEVPVDRYGQYLKTSVTRGAGFCYFYSSD